MDFRSYLKSLPVEQQIQLQEKFKKHPLAAPQPGPQTQMFNCPADIMGAGGSAGGGKSSMIALLVIHSHERSIIFRRDKDQINSLIDDIVSFYGSDEGLNRQGAIFRFKDRPNHRVQWSQLRDPGDEQKHQGQPRDLMAFDEATQMNINQINYVMGWNRTETPGQRCRVVMTFNPPGSLDISGDGTSVMAEQGRWVIDYFAPWLDERHFDPAEPGEIRWYYRDDHGREHEKRDGRPVTVFIGGKEFKQKPKSRCFIPSRVTDNEYLMDTGYMEHLMSLQEPLRSQLLLGDFRAGIVDSERQLLKAEWVDDAMERWEKQKFEGRSKPMDSMGVDVSRGGNDFTVIARRHEFFWDEMIRLKGTETDTGQKVASAVVSHLKNGAEINIDVVGVGASPYDILRASGVKVNAVVSQKRTALPKADRNIKLLNLRAALWWLMRKILDPANGCDAALPKDNRLRTELISPKYEETGQGLLQIESKDEIKRRLGHSTDEADAVVYTLLNFMKSPLSDMINNRPKPALTAEEFIRRQNNHELHDWMTL